MKAERGFLLALAALCLLLFLIVGLTAGAVWIDLPADARPMLADLLLPRLGLALMVLMAACFVFGMLLSWFWRVHVVGPKQAVEQLQLMLDANPDYRLETREQGALQPLYAAANRLADQRDALRRDVEAQVFLAKTSIEAEKNRLAALMSELNQSVVVCNLDGRILLYNQRARGQFQSSETERGREGAIRSTPIGLGRSIFAVIDPSLIGHALDALQAQLNSAVSPLQPVSHFVTATRAGQLMRVQMAPVLAADALDGVDSVAGEASDARRLDANPAVRTISGYVLMFDDITRAVESETRRDGILQSLTEGSRAMLANVRAASEALLDYPGMEPEQRERFLRIIGDEVSGMGLRLDKMLSEYADSLKARWPLEEMLGVELVAAAQRRIESRLGISVKIDMLDPELWVKVDSYSLIQALSYLAGRLQEACDVRLLRFRLTRAGRLAHFDMVWSGGAMSSETIYGWEREPLNLSGESSPLTLHDIMDRHGGEFWFQRESATQQAYFRLLVPVAAQQPGETLAASFVGRGASRPEYYDFDLFKRTDQNHALDDRLLTELGYTVFDTETTGLDPSAGDEIIQIGALRIVNGRLLRHESFEQLIDPRRSMSAESIAIHGISRQMLVGQPTIERVLPAFAQFVEDTVLIAHNAAFDMRFLQLKEAATGICFNQPVLDTLLLSAVVHPNQESHKLEAIAERLGVSVIGRHTALGDAIVTGEVFLRMIPLLNAMGIYTLGEALAAARQTYYARVKY